MIEPGQGDKSEGKYCNRADSTRGKDECLNLSMNRNGDWLSVIGLFDDVYGSDATIIYGKVNKLKSGSTEMGL